MLDAMIFRLGKLVLLLLQHNYKYKWISNDCD